MRRPCIVEHLGTFRPGIVDTINTQFVPDFSSLQAISLHGFSNLGPKIWNNLHSDLKSAESINNFKHEIKDNLFKELQKREDNPINITRFPKLQIKQDSISTLYVDRENTFFTFSFFFSRNLFFQ